MNRLDSILTKISAVKPGSKIELSCSEYQRLSSKEMNELVNCLKELSDSIHTTLSFEDMILKEQAKELIDLLVSSTMSMHWLNLRNTNIDDVVLDFLSNRIAACTDPLQFTLDLSYNSFTKSALLKLFETITSLDTSSDISIVFEGCDLNDEIIKQLCPFISRTKCQLHIDMSNNFLSGESASALSTALGANTQITYRLSYDPERKTHIDAFYQIIDSDECRHVEKNFHRGNLHHARINHQEQLTLEKEKTAILDKKIQKLKEKINEKDKEILSLQVESLSSVADEMNAASSISDIKSLETQLEAQAEKLTMAENEAKKLKEALSALESPTVPVPQDPAPPTPAIELTQDAEPTVDVAAISEQASMADTALTPTAVSIIKSLPKRSAIPTHDAASASSIVPSEPVRLDFNSPEKFLSYMYDLDDLDVIQAKDLSERQICIIQKTIVLAKEGGLINNALRMKVLSLKRIMPAKLTLSDSPTSCEEEQDTAKPAILVRKQSCAPLSEKIIAQKEEQSVIKRLQRNIKALKEKELPKDIIAKFWYYHKDKTGFLNSPNKSKNSLLALKCIEKLLHADLDQHSDKSKEVISYFMECIKGVKAEMAKLYQSSEKSLAMFYAKELYKIIKSITKLAFNPADITEVHGVNKDTFLQQLTQHAQYSLTVITKYLLSNHDLIQVMQYVESAEKIFPKMNFVLLLNIVLEAARNYQANGNFEHALICYDEIIPLYNIYSPAPTTTNASCGAASSSSSADAVPKIHKYSHIIRDALNLAIMCQDKVRIDKFLKFFFRSSKISQDDIRQLPTDIAIEPTVYKTLRSLLEIIAKNLIDYIQQAKLNPRLSLDEKVKLLILEIEALQINGNHKEAAECMSKVYDQNPDVINSAVYLSPMTILSTNNSLLITHCLRDSSISQDWFDDSKMLSAYVNYAKNNPSVADCFKHYTHLSFKLTSRQRITLFYQEQSLAVTSASSSNSAIKSHKTDAIAAGPSASSSSSLVAASSSSSASSAMPVIDVPPSGPKGPPPPPPPGPSFTKKQPSYAQIQKICAVLYSLFKTHRDRNSFIDALSYATDNDSPGIFSLKKFETDIVPALVDITLSLKKDITISDSELFTLFQNKIDGKITPAAYKNKSFKTIFMDVVVKNIRQQLMRAFSEVYTTCLTKEDKPKLKCRIFGYTPYDRVFKEIEPYFGYLIQRLIKSNNPSETISKEELLAEFIKLVEMKEFGTSKPLKNWEAVKNDKFIRLIFPILELAAREYETHLAANANKKSYKLPSSSSSNPSPSSSGLSMEDIKRVAEERQQRREKAGGFKDPLKLKQKKKSPFEKEMEKRRKDIDNSSSDEEDNDSETPVTPQASLSSPCRR